MTGGYPGDGKPKPVSFPDPSGNFEEIDGIKCITLAKLVELKLAAGTAEWRLKDLADVQEMIRAFRLPESFGDKVDESVRPSFLRLWKQANSAPHDDQG